MLSQTHRRRHLQASHAQHHCEEVVREQQFIAGTSVAHHQQPARQPRLDRVLRVGERRMGGRSRSSATASRSLLQQWRKLIPLDPLVVVLVQLG